MGMARRWLTAALLAATFLRLPLGGGDYVYIAADNATPILTIGPSTTPGLTAISFRDGTGQNVKVPPEVIIKALGATTVAIQ